MCNDVQCTFVHDLLWAALCNEERTANFPLLCLDHRRSRRQKSFCGLTIRKRHVFGRDMLVNLVKRSQLFAANPRCLHGLPVRVPAENELLPARQLSRPNDYRQK